MRRFLVIEVIFDVESQLFFKTYTIPYKDFEGAENAAETLERNSARLTWFKLVSGHILKPPVTMEEHKGNGEVSH